MDTPRIQRARHELYAAPLLAQRPLADLPRLRVLMEHHVFAVWDFMCLAKALQHHLAPSSPIWTPPRHREGARLINEIVLCEESDVPTGDRGPLSHYELYLEAMEQVGADAEPVKRFVALVASAGPELALRDASIPPAARDFVSQTLCWVVRGKPWEICAAFALGREAVIPEMFTALRQNDVVRGGAFDLYLQRHIEVDGGDEAGGGHGAMALRLLQSLCECEDAEQQTQRRAQAEQAAVEALRARRRFWNAVYALLPMPATASAKRAATCQS